MSLLAYTDPNLREMIHYISEAGLSNWHRDGLNITSCWKQKSKEMVEKCYM
jgi:hypothetical protein